MKADPPPDKRQAPKPLPHYMEVIIAWLGALAGIGIVAFLAGWWSRPAALMLIGSYGASAVLLYGAPRSPFAQPRNLIGGHLFSAIIGVAAYKLLPDTALMAAPLAVATAIAVMQLTHTLHPPGGATALIAVIGPPEVHQVGWLYPLPVVIGAGILLAVALVTNNLPGQKPFPERWL